MSERRANDIPTTYRPEIQDLYNDMKDLPIEELDIYWDKAKSIICKTEERKND